MNNLAVNMPNIEMDSLRQQYLLRKVDKLAKEGLLNLLGDVLTRTSEELITIAGNCQEPTLQRLYFDSLCQLYGKRERILECYGLAFSQYYHGAMKPVQEDDNDAFSVEEVMLVKQQITSLSILQIEQQQNLAESFSFIYQTDVPTASLPVGGAVVVKAFSQAMSEFTCPYQVKRVFYDGWQQQLEEALPTLWDDVSSFLRSEFYGQQRYTTTEALKPKLNPDYVPELIKHLQQNQQENRQQIVKDQVARVAQQIDSELSKLCDGKRIAEPLDSLFQGPWRSLLISIMVEEGEQSLRWQIAHEITRELIWSVQAISTPKQRQSLVKRLPQLLHGVRSCLEEITWEEVDTQRIFDELEQIHLGNLRGPAAND